MEGEPVLPLGPGVLPEWRVSTDLPAGSVEEHCHCHFIDLMLYHFLDVGASPQRPQGPNPPGIHSAKESD